MKASKKSWRLRSDLTNRAAVQTETRVSIMVTVGWMLGALATLAAEVFGVVVNTIVVVTQSAPAWMQAVSKILFFTASITGLVTLLITPVCLRIRHAPPPKPITLLVIVITTTPLLVLVMRTLRN
jgi:hypothetical protein